MDAKDIKVGDRVRVVRVSDKDEKDGFKVGENLTVKKLSPDRLVAWFNDKNGLGLYLHQLEPITATPESTDTKDTNPKDAIGSLKLPLHLVPDSLKAYAALAFLEGATKYGASNWRVAGVRASIYKSALERHLAKWWNGEWADPKTGVPHLASVLACAGIILDAGLVGKLTDDRPPVADLSGMIDGMEPQVKHLIDMHADKHPHHHTIYDGKLGECATDGWVAHNPDDPMPEKLRGKKILIRVRNGGESSTPHIAEDFTWEDYDYSPGDIVAWKLA